MRWLAIILLATTPAMAQHSMHSMAHDHDDIDPTKIDPAVEAAKPDVTIHSKYFLPPDTPEQRAEHDRAFWRQMQIRMPSPDEMRRLRARHGVR